MSLARKYNRAGLIVAVIFNFILNTVAYTVIFGCMFIYHYMYDALLDSVNPFGLLAVAILLVFLGLLSSMVLFDSLWKLFSFSKEELCIKS